jgi:hypothetical protein
MLFDDDEQLEVRHVISLMHHDISIYSGGDVTPEGELFIKRNALCLARKPDGAEMAPDTQVTKPFFLFSENCSAKEDFYFALLRNQEQMLAAEHASRPKPVQFDVKNIISLVQKLHSSDDHVQTRWLNGMIGRIFLGIHRTKDLEAFIRAKITKKISRVKTPSFLSDIVIREINTGDAAPYFTNPKLKDLTVEGECGVEVDVRYTGNFRIEVATKARIDLGSRFKVREVDLVLAVSVRKVEGHLLFKIKPPPSNRIWFTFQQAPKVELHIEPIVSARQITYTVILRQIENRIKEVIAESVVLPFWDDVPFFKTEHKRWRGGIFSGDDHVESPSDPEFAAAEQGDLDEVEKMEEGGPAEADLPPMEKSHSVPVLENTAPTGFFGRKGKLGLGSPKASASTTGFDTKNGHTPPISTPLKPVHSPSIANANASDSMEDPHQVYTDELSSSSTPADADHANAMAILSGRRDAGGASSNVTPAGSPLRSSALSKASSQSSLSSKEAVGGHKDDDKDDTPKAPGRLGSQDSGIGVDGATSLKSDSGSLKGRSLKSQTGSIKSQAGSITGGLFRRRDSGNVSRSSMQSDSAAGPGSEADTARADGQKRNTLAAVSNAAGVAKRWGLNALQRHQEAVERKRMSGGAGNFNDSQSQVDLSQPMGRGQPLPPPGMPLPGPQRRSNGRSNGQSVPQPKRKPLAPPPLPERDGSGSSIEGKDLKDEQHKVEGRPVPPPPLPRRRQLSHPDREDEADGDEMLVVEAPLADSEPASPAASAKEGRGYIQSSVDEEDDGVGLGLGDASGEEHEDHHLGQHAGSGGTAPNAEEKELKAEEDHEEEEKEREMLEEDLQPQLQPSSSELPLENEKVGLGLPAKQPASTSQEEHSRASPHTGAEEDEDGVSAWMDDSHEDEQEAAGDDEVEHQHGFGYEQAAAPRIDEALVTREGMAL